MKYTGKLYGKIAISYFDTGCTSDDYDLLTTSLAEANKQNFQLLQDKLKLEGEIFKIKKTTRNITVFYINEIPEIKWHPIIRIISNNKVKFI